MVIDIRRIGDISIVTIDGEIMGDAWIDVDNALQNELERDPSPEGMIIDLKGVPVLDCAGFGILVAVYTRIRKQKKKVALFNVGKDAGYLLALIRLNLIFEKYENEDEAIASFAKK